MNTFLIIVQIFVGILLPVLDVYSTWINNSIDGIHESNRYFKRPDGHADIPKLLIVKAVITGTLLCTAVYIYLAMDGGAISFVVMPLFAAVHVPAVIKNFSLHFQKR